MNDTSRKTIIVLTTLLVVLCVVPCLVSIIIGESGYIGLTEWENK